MGTRMTADLATWPSRRRTAGSGSAGRGRAPIPEGGHLDQPLGAGSGTTPESKGGARGQQLTDPMSSCSRQLGFPGEQWGTLCP